MHTITSALLILAIALSWDRFVTIFRSGTRTDVATAPTTMIAAAVSLSSLGLAFGGGVLPGALVAVCGLLLSRIMRVGEPLLAISMSAICLAAYLQLSLPTV